METKQVWPNGPATEEKPYEYIIQYTNGFDLDLAYPGKTNSYRIVHGIDELTLRGTTAIATLVKGEWDYFIDIPENHLAIIRHYSKLYYNVEF